MLNSGVDGRFENHEDYVASMFAEGYGDDKSLSVAVGKVITNRLLSTKSENSPKNRLQQERRVK